MINTHIDIDGGIVTNRNGEDYDGIKNDVGNEWIIITGIYDEAKRRNIPLMPNGYDRQLYATCMGHEFWYKCGRQVFTTYHTTFSRQVSPEEFISLYANNEVMPGALFIIDEVDRWLSSHNKRGASGAMLQHCISTRRQMQIDLIGTCERYMDVVKWIRDQASRIFVVQTFYPPYVQISKKGVGTGRKKEMNG